MYKVVWTVIAGKQNGRKIWFPTVNVSLKNSDLEDAVYCLNISIENTVYRWVWTYLKSKSLFEAHIFDFDTDIYGQEVSIYIKSKIRNNRKFNDFNELQKQISEDVIIAQEKQHTVLTFWSFDVIHPGHKYYLTEARKYGEELITIVARDENIERIKWQKTHNSTNKRVEDIKKLWISNSVIAGSIKNPMNCLWEYTPDSICLWYDQRWPFVEKISKKLEELHLETQIIRIEPHEPEIYKSSLLKQKNNSTM